MDRTEAIAILSGRMVGAVNYYDYTAWLSRQTYDMLVALATGQPVHVLQRQPAA